MNLRICLDDGLSYCTWNGLGQNLTEEKLFNALESLSKNGINVSNLIIDDNWQSLVSVIPLSNQNVVAHVSRMLKVVTNLGTPGWSLKLLRKDSLAVSKPP